MFLLVFQLRGSLFGRVGLCLHTSAEGAGGPLNVRSNRVGLKARGDRHPLTSRPLAEVARALRGALLSLGCITEGTIRYEGQCRPAHRFEFIPRIGNIGGKYAEFCTSAGTGVKTAAGRE